MDNTISENEDLEIKDWKAQLRWSKLTSEAESTDDMF